MNIHHADGGELLQYLLRGQPGRRMPCKILHGDLEAVGNKRLEELDLDPFLLLVEHRSTFRSTVLSLRKARLIDRTAARRNVSGNDGPGTPAESGRIQTGMPPAGPGSGTACPSGSFGSDPADSPWHCPRTTAGTAATRCRVRSGGNRPRPSGCPATAPP